MPASTKRKVFLATAFVSLAIFSLAAPGCSRHTSPWDGLGGPPRVLVSFAPLYSFAKNVAGNDAAVLSLMTSQGPHEHETVPEDAQKFEKANVFYMIGLQLEKRGLVDRLKENSHNRDAAIVELGETDKLKKRLLKGEEEDEHEHEHGHDDEHGHGHEHGTYDPHVWLGIPEAIIIVETIRDDLMTRDPEHKEGYRERAANYIKQLKALHKYGLAALQKKKNRKLVTMHESLAYFARSFKLDIVGSIQTRPGEEADPQKIAQLVKLCRKENVRVIAVEPQYPESSAEALKKELARKGVKDVRIITLDPLETVTGELHAGVYVRKMRENIDTLRKALP
jgi:ABC-type Zn uptake system ZnuABC Zn-binding protein ZnuA